MQPQDVCSSDLEILEDVCSDLRISGCLMEITFGSIQPLLEDSL